MVFKIVQAATITVVIYLLIGLNVVQTNGTADIKIEPPEALVALRQAFAKR